jgi:hypothetical protein
MSGSATASYEYSVTPKNGSLLTVGDLVGTNVTYSFTGDNPFVAGSSVIDFANIYVGEVAMTGGQAFVALSTSGGYTIFSNISLTAGAIVNIDSTAEFTPCFAAGTRILTVLGEVAVEKLEPGMMLVTAHAGVQPVKWIGTRHYAGAFIAGNRDVLPIVIKAGAIDDGVPARDLTVSPGHAMMIDGALVHAKRLLNGRTIIQRDAVDAISYFHIEMASHEVIFAEHAPAETFMDEQFRRQFQNAASFFARYPGERAAAIACLPSLSGFALAAARARLAARAGIAPRAPHAAGPLRGFIDQAGAICTGWAFDTAHPDEPVVLDVYCGTLRLARVLANEFRADLRAAGFGADNCGFTVALPPAAGPLTVRRAADGAELAWTDDARRNARVEVVRQHAA